MRLFFFDPVFAWSYIVVLAALTAVMAVIDLRTAIIPKKWTLGTLAAGMIAQVLRVALLAHAGKPLLFFQTGNVFLGAIEGFGYALVGALVGFGLMFVLWILGVCGGGDVKLIAAVGAWVGVILIGQVILVSIIALAAIIAIRILTGQVKMAEVNKMKRPNAPLSKADPASNPIKPSRLRTTYSLPIFIAVVIVMLFTFRGELALDTPTAPPAEVPNNAQQ